MKNLLNLMVIIIFSTTLLSFNYPQKNQSKPNNTTKLQVLYFHGTNRCVTCNAVENNTKKILEEHYKTQLNNGIIKFIAYNIDEEANKTIVEKYEVAFSTLLLIKADGSKIDFTDKAFQYAKTNPTKYTELFKAEIDKNLK